MSEEETKQEGKEEKKEEPADDTDKGSEPKAVSTLDRVHADVKRMEEIEKNFGEKLERMEEILAKNMIGGITEGGSIPKLSQEDKTKLEAEEIVKGYF